ncbi:acyloxyacyl hydrolase [Chitinolyticbacter meiyuanensis]|uniref:acyloxyacyl hydrolase n=1 Tax=Chitinolyticbacter meiyuanensis TaxID=682798 RepID=UPI0011E5ACFF|nr:acyloxyacyl hydrolase [Chitinolyticbacter meiyuanensis]
MKCRGLGWIAWLALAQPGHAEDLLQLNLGASIRHDGKDGGELQQLAWRRSWQPEWLPSKRLSLQLDLSLSHWQLDGHSNWVPAITPVLRYTLADDWACQPYAEYGLGASLLSDLQVTEKRRFSTYFQFVNRLALGCRLDGRHELALEAMHYSNAYIDTPNPGIEFVTLRYGYVF